MAKKLMRQALGRYVRLGDLYDAKTDNVHHNSGFKTSTDNLQEDIKTFDWYLIDLFNIADVLSGLRVEGELQLSVISGLCVPKYNAAFHLITQAQTVTHKKTKYGILLRVITQKEMLSPKDESEVDGLEIDLKKIPATHFVQEVIYGGNVFVSLARKFPESCHVNANGCYENVDDRMKGILQTFKECFEGISFEVDQDDIIIDGTFNHKFISIINETFNIEIISDLSSFDRFVAKSFKEALEYLKRIPYIIDEFYMDKGGQPMSFSIVPIRNVDKIVPSHHHFQAIPDETIFAVLKSFYEMARLQLKTNEAFDVMEEHDIYVSDEDLDSISTMKRRYNANFKDAQKELAVLLKKVRAGTEPPSKFHSFIIINEEKPYGVKKIKQALNRLNDNTLVKLKIIEILMQENVHYVGKQNSFKEYLEDKAEDVYALHYNTEAMKKNKVQWKATFQEFLGYAKNSSNTCVFVDNDFPTGDRRKDNIGISHLKNGRRVYSDNSKDDSDDASEVDSKHSSDDTIDMDMQDADGEDGEHDQPVNSEDERDEICYIESSEVKPTTTNPRKKAYLKLPCPVAASSYSGPSNFCSNVSKTWHCSKCQNIVMYGFNNNFYCTCGNASWDSFKFLCNCKFHEETTSKPLDVTKYIKLLNNLEPLKELNILIMGETGVGKSTWINSFVNYLTYDTMEEAEKHGPKYLIGSSFVMTDEDYVPVEITMGPTDNDHNTKGQSTTQMPSSYIFPAGELMVRLVDTPGVGDTRGIDQDKENFQNILSHISHLEELHGICILLKSNSARLTITFQFCIKELLTHLHKDACKNIVFVFTNARETFYRPGDTFATLRNLLRETKDINISLGKETIFCMDNESMRFLAATNQGMTFNEEDRANYSNSWRKAVCENERLVQHILALHAHSTRQTLSLNEARRLILGLTEPLAQISQNIQNNITLAQARRDEINDMVARSDDLKGKLTTPTIVLDPREIPYPRTVCTAANCVEVREVNGISKVNYKTWCHEHCYLTNVQVQKYPSPELQQCYAMDQRGKCNHCGCYWDVHMHITYECVEVTKQVINKNVQELLEKEKDSIAAVEKFLVDIEDRINKLKDEQTTINKVASKCGTFLKQNAITPYNDSVDEYLQQCIRVQKDLVYAGANDKTLKGLERMLANYREEVKILDMSMKDHAAGHRIHPDDIPNMIKQLYTLPISGKSLKSIADMAMTAKINMVAYQEKVYTTSYKKSENFLKKAWDKGKNSLASFSNLF